jgi:hypothetical protein
MNNKTQTAPAAEPATFSTDTSNLEDCLAPALVELADGDTFDLRIAPVAKTLGDSRVRMLAYNGSMPGPDASDRSTWPAPASSTVSTRPPIGRARSSSNGWAPATPSSGWSSGAG